jgi:hypothetical protein
MVLHFQNKEKYRKWNAYRHIHGKAEGGRQKVVIHGRTHKVHHYRA